MSAAPSVLFNLSFLIDKPTGLMVYATNLLPHLDSLNLIPLSNRPVPGRSHHTVPGQMNADGGSRGHLRRLLWTQVQVPQLYRQYQADLLFSPIPEAPLYSSVRSVVTVHDLIPLRFGAPRSPLTLYQRYYLPLVLRQAAHIITNSEATARDVADVFHIPAHRLTPIPLAYDAAHFRWLDRPTQPYFLYVGRCDPYKNVGGLITAFAQVAPAIAPDIGLKIAGSYDARYTPQLQQQVRELGLEHRVEFLNYVSYDELPILMGEAIALVFPSLWEGFGLPVLEAMACGTPVISSNRASLPEVVGDAALLLDPEDSTAWADAMETLTRDNTLHHQLRDAGIQQAQRFSWAKTGQATATVLQQSLP